MKTASATLSRFVCYVLVTALLTATKTIAQSGTTPCLQVQCPTNKTVACGSVWTFDQPLASTCCTNLVGFNGVATNLVVMATGVVTNGACSNLITQIWIISDGCGDSTNCSQTVTEVNTNPPFILCPPNITVSSCTNVQEFYAPIASAACGLTNVTVVCTPPSGSFFAPGTVTVVNCTATDCSGNSNSCSFVVTVNAQLTVTCPTNKTVVSSSNWSFDPPIASTCCTNLIAASGVPTNLLIIPINTVTNGTCPQYDVTRTWVIHDGCGDTTNCSQTVTVLCCVPPPPNMVLWLPFDETSGITAANLASPPNPGTHIGGPTVVLGAYVDNSLNFSGVNQYVSVPDYPAIDIGTGNLTIDAWVLREPNDANSPPSVIVDKRDINTGIGYSLSLSYGELILTLSGNNYRDTNGSVPPDGLWHFVAVVLNQASTTPYIQFYVDTGPTGVAVPTPSNLANTHPFWVAASQLGGNQPWLGDIDEVEIYDRALANSELATIFNAGTAGKCKPPCTGITVICPTNKTVQCGTSWNFDDPIASTCCTNLIVGTGGVATNLLVIPTGLVTNGACSNLITQTWTITDGCGDSNTCSQTVTEVNTNPPFILCPPNITVSSCTNVQEFYAPFASAACGLTNVTVVCTPPSGSFFAPGTVTVVNCTATDCSGNMNTCSFTVTVNAILTVTCPTNKTVVSSSNWNFDPPIASTCCTNLIAASGVPTNLLVIPINTVTNGSCPQYQVTRTWLIQDGCGDSTNCIQTVTVLCCVPPPANMVLWLPFDETTGINAANLASPPDPGTHINNPTVVLGAYVDNSLHFNGTNYVSVPDYPAIDIGTGNLTIDAWVLREPNDGNSPPSVIVDKRDINTGVGYSLSLSYGELILTLSGNNYRDTNGFVPPDGLWHFVAVVLNQASTTPYIQFYVDTGPTGVAIPIPSNLANTHPFWVAASQLGGNQPWLGDIDEVEVYDRALANSELATIFNAGTAGKCKPPCVGITVTCPTNKTVPCGSSWQFDQPIASTCCTNLIAASGVLTNLLVIPTTLVTNGPCANIITQTWSITDGCGDSNSCSQTVTVANTNPPFILCPPNITVSSCTNVQEFYAPFASAACGLTNVTVVCTPPSGSFFAPGSVTVVNCTATDCSGNMNTCSFTVTVNAILTVTCPTNKTVVSSSNWSFDPPIASTCCTNLIAGAGTTLTNLLVIPISTVTNGTCPQYDVTRTWVIHDGCGDTTNCSQTVTVLCCVPPPPNMVLWLPFDETSGITAANLASPPNPGTHIGGPTVVLGAYVDNSLNFSGVNQYVSVPDYPAIDIGTGNLTIDAWVLREPNDGNSPPSVIVDKRDINTGVGYSLSLSYGELILTLSGNNYRDTNGFVPPDGLWHFVAVVLNQATPGGIQFYVDTGPTGTAIPVPGNLDNTNSLWVAASPLGGNQPWVGDIDEVEIYDRALANSELASIYNAGIAGKCKPACSGITVTCPTNKIAQCGTPWNFDQPIASTCCTNLIPGTGTTLTNLLVLPTGTVTNGICPKLVTRTWMITDGCGDSASCTQQVTVIDTTPPIINCPTNTIVVNFNTNCLLVIPLIHPPAFDNCTPASQLIYTQSPTNGTLVNASSQIVTVTVTDLCGNSSQCHVRVVGRFPPPIINCPGVITVTNCVMPNVLPLVSATGCNGNIPFVFTQSPPPGTPLGPGSDTVTVTVTGLGGSDSCVIAIQYGPQMSFLNVLTNTGIAVNGSLLPNYAVDPHFTLGPVPGAVPGYTVPQAVVITNEWPTLEGTPYVSQWIAPCTLAGPGFDLFHCPPGFYTYTNQFVLPLGIDASTASISGRWAADDGAAAMLFNGALTTNSIPINYGFNHWTPFIISSNFLAYPATNTILFIVTNASQYGNSPTGLRVEYTNAFSGCTNCAPPAVVWMTPSTSLPPGGTAVFTVNVSGTLPLTYQWYHNNVPLTPGPHYPGGVNGPTLTITPVSITDSGTYYVVVANPCGQVQSPTRTLSVVPGWNWNWAWWNFQIPNNYLLANVGPNLLVVGPSTNLLGTGTTLDFGLPGPASGIANVLDVPSLPADTSIQVPLIAPSGSTSDSSYTIIMDLYQPDTSLGTPNTLFASAGCCISNLTSGGQDGVTLTLDAKNNLHITGSAAGTSFDAASATPVPADVWNRVALVVDDPQDGVGVNVSVYLNGQLVASQAVSTPVGLPINWSNSPPILLSVLSDATSRNGEIYVSSIQFHSVALQPEMIAGMGSPADGPMLADNPAIVTPPAVSVSYRADGSINLSWSGNDYILQETSNLSSGDWVDSAVQFTETTGSTGTTTTATVKPAPGGPVKFYRLVFRP